MSGVPWKMSCGRRILLISTRMILINRVFASACEWAVMEQQRLNKREEGSLERIEQQRNNCEVGNVQVIYYLWI